MQVCSNIKKNVSVALLIAINLLFVWKYLSRVTGYAWIGSLIMLIIYISIWILKDKIAISGRQYKFFSKAALLIFFLLSVMALRMVSPESLIVDRWSVISSFWKAAIKHEYPYSALSHLGNIPGPMPGYFLIAFPFFLLGAVGYMAIFAVFVYYYISEKAKATAILKLWNILFIMGSVFIWWEIVCRSTIFFNSIIILACIIWFNSISKQEDKRSLYFWAIVIGFSLSTRSVLAIPVIISFLSALRRKEIGIKEMICACLIAVLVFCITFLPFILFSPGRFLINNPIITQSTYLMPFGFSTCFILIAAGVSLFSKSATEDFLYSGLVLFATIMGYFVYHIVKSGFTQSYFGSSADISYFIFCVPFLQYYIVAKGKKEEEESG